MSNPAVCVVLKDPEDVADVAGVVATAREEGFQVVVGDQRGIDRDDFLSEAFEAHVHRLDSELDRNTAESRLVEQVRGDGYPGAIIHEPGTNLDLARARTRLESSDQYVISTTREVPPGIDAELLVGIPAYNEEIGIGSIIHSAEKYASEIIVVDDGSTDRTVPIAERAGATVIEHDENHGKGRAIRTIFEAVSDRKFDALVLLDGDGQHVPEDIPTVVDPVLEDECEISIGSRYLEDKNTETPAYRRFGQRVLDILTTGSARTKVTDSQSGFRALSPTAIDKLRLRTDGMGVESEMISDATGKGLEIEEVPIDVRYEGIDGQTFNPLRHGLSVATFILQLVRDRHPMLFFGIPGLVLTLFGAMYGLDGILVYQQTGNFYPAKVFVAGFTSIIGVLGIFCGLILNRISNMIHHSSDSTEQSSLR